ncbi:MAG: dihydroorotase [Gammaproteobacteria bacterium]|nr:dihydroorotase [Gammaproteobacteria bacterium]NIR98026.1 dihydroorotase [Gammaproteobacteria bacterium]NIT63733.1 dihydroorotase [Gammaproteobacteria bacterium]NIV19908.1 dihydroorotase [Gammaproteobacteria bacterium]NIX11397.1 dihydroorotase [Gammaproteobacteria bacterium]
MSPDSISLTRPDDWHLHVRDGEVLHAVVPHSAERFGRAIIMPNLEPPVTATPAAESYRERILQAVPAGRRFTPLMTLYLTQDTTVREIERAARSEHVAAVKLYPAGATTHSEAGVRDLPALYPVLEAMEQHALPLLVHGEVTDPAVDVFDRERVFIERHLAPLIERLPELRVVLEHATTREAVDFVRAGGENIAATITPHHLLMNRNRLFDGGLRPHHFCLPVLKREAHRQALLEAATSGDPSFFLGTDSAPHPRRAKECARGCAGIYSAHAALELYAEAFEEAGVLARLEAFASFHGADFYGLPRNTERITLRRESWEVPQEYALGEETVVPLRAGEPVRWRLQPDAAARP